MLHEPDLRRAAERIGTAALLGLGWEASLADMSFAAGARGAVLMRNRGHRLVASLTTEDVREPVGRFARGETPPSPRQVRASFGEHKGFRFDQDDFTMDELAAEPFYQEFLRPVGLFWHANARLATEPGEWVSLSFKRALKAGPYERRDKLALDAILPELRAAVVVAGEVGRALGTGVAQVMGRRGSPVFQLDSWGRVLNRQDIADPGDAAALGVTGGLLQCRHPGAQLAIDAAVFRAIVPPRQSAVATWQTPAGRREVLHVMPVRGVAQDVLRTTAAVAVLLDMSGQDERSASAARELSRIFGLTEREVAIALRLSRGDGVAEMSASLGVATGTMRNHLKNIFEKTGCRRQAELVALVASCTI